ncbi:MAG: plasmid mobilization protein [Erythrobacter sp.]
MARPEKHEGGSKAVSFRLSTADHQAYKSKCDEAGLSPSDFFRECVLKNRTQIVARPKPSADRSRMLFLMNKASNNINQLAHQVNAASKSRVVSEGTYTQILARLSELTAFMRAGVGHVD